MRFHRLLAVSGLILILGASLMFVGCGSDDENNVIIGSYDDPEFVAVQDQMNVFVDSTVQSIASGLNSISSISTYDDQIDIKQYVPIWPDSSSITAAYINGWHIVNIISSKAEWQFRLSDSIQFYNDGQVQQNVAGLDSMYFKHHWNFAKADTMSSYANLNGDCNWRFNGLNTQVTVMNGWQNYFSQVKLVGDQNRIVRHFSVEAETNNLNVNKTGSGWAQGCPSSGTITATIEMTTWVNDQAPVTTTWQATFTFNEGTVSANIIRNNVNWYYQNDVCNAVN